MSDEKEPIKIEFSAKIMVKKSMYDFKEVLHVDFKESVQPGQDPVKYLRQRLGEEITRQAAFMKPIDGYDVTPKEKDPLTGEELAA